MEMYINNTFQTVSYKGYFLHLSPGNVKVQAPNGEVWKHSYSTIRQAKADIRSMVRIEEIR